MNCTNCNAQIEKDDCYVKTESELLCWQCQTKKNIMVAEIEKSLEDLTFETIKKMFNLI